MNLYRKMLFSSNEERWFYEQYVIPAVLKRDNYKCVKCNSTKSLDVSHNHYFKNLSIKDLETLCRSCHKKKDNEENIFLTKERCDTVKEPRESKEK